MHADSLQSCPTLWDPMDCSLSGSSVHGILQARILELVAMPSSRAIFPTQALNLYLLCLLLWREGSSLLAPPGKPFAKCQSVQSLSRVRLFATPWTAACQDSLSISNSQSLLKLMSIALVVPSNHFILCHPLLLPPSIFPSTRVFSSESVLHIRWPKYWSFRFSINPSNEYSGLIFRMDWLDLLAVQGTLKSLLQHHSSKASVLRRSAFFTVQLSHPYMTTGKTIALTNGPLWVK